MKDTCCNQNCNQGRTCPHRKPKERAMPTHGQSKSMSMVEAVVNTVVGLVVAMIATAAICKAYSIPMTWENNFIITFWMTVLSVLRSYLLRRLFNAQWRPCLRRLGVRLSARLGQMQSTETDQHTSRPERVGALTTEQAEGLRRRLP